MINKQAHFGYQRGFTLVELAMVLVVVGLLLSGVVKGSDMVKKAKAERMVADLNALSTTVLDYKKQRGRLPGDCNNDGIVMVLPPAFDQIIGTGNLDPFSAAPVQGAVCTAIADEVATAANLPWDELKAGGAFEAARPISQIARHQSDDYFSVGYVTNGAINANAIFVHGIPLSLAAAIDRAVDPIITGTDPATAGQLGRVRLCATGPTNLTCGSGAREFPATTDADTLVTISYQYDVRTL